MDDNTLLLPYMHSLCSALICTNVAIAIATTLAIKVYRNISAMAKFAPWKLVTRVWETSFNAKVAQNLTNILPRMQRTQSKCYAQVLMSWGSGMSWMSGISWFLIWLSYQMRITKGVPGSECRTRGQLVGCRCSLEKKKKRTSSIFGQIELC